MLLLFVFSALAALAAAQDQCSQFKTCVECLNITSTENFRQYCGWCHMDVVYKNGTTDSQCADIRQSWVCPAVFDTYQCTAGYICDYSTGQCKLGPPGAGYPDIATCQQHCFPTPDTYICNTTTYTCDKCADPSDPKCYDKDTACKNCQAPVGQFRCDKTNATSPQCIFCDPGQSGCTDFQTACGNCSVPPPPPPPTPPPPPPHQNFTCDTSVLQCVEVPTGQPFEACSAFCSNSTPPLFTGKWRGFQAQVGFRQGEWDFDFENASVKITDPDGAVTNGQVYVLGNMRIKLLDGPHAGHELQAMETELSYGPETKTIALSFGDYDQPPPYNLPDALSASNGATSYFLSQCHTWSQACTFTKPAHAVAALRKLAMSKPVAAFNTPALGMTSFIKHLYGPIGHPSDFCNQYTSCDTCISNHTDFQCGWCMGATIVYNDTGDSGLKCGGFIDGQPLPFLCAKDFRTEACDGFACNYTATPPACYKSDDGTFTDMDSCDTACQPAHYSKCNLQTKICEPCSQSDPGCSQTSAECQASCSLEYKKCNFTTKQCVSCDRLTDPNCTQSGGDCDRTCSQSNYGICDPLTGKCHPCDPSSGPGCVGSCNDTCTQDKHFKCDNTTLQCVMGAGNETLEDCSKSCHNATEPTYGCVWNSSQPMCVQGAGTLSQGDCLNFCKPAEYSKCDHTTGLCASCDPKSDPSCIYTEDYCKASCNKSEVLGVWRGIQINTNYVRGEYDFTFYPDGTVSFWKFSDPRQLYRAYVKTTENENADGAPIVLTLASIPTSGPVPGNLGQKLAGIFESLSGEAGVTTFLYLAVSLPDATPITTFATGMTNLEFVLVSCKTSATSTSHCDFTPAQVPERLDARMRRFV